MARPERPDLRLAALPSDRRERKKQQTHELLRMSALRLFAEKGFEQTTVQDIADGADVAQRTFFLHFASKEQVLIGDTADRARQFMDVLRSRPDDEDGFTALRAALVHVVETSDMDDDELMLRARLVEEAPSLMAWTLEQNAAVAEAIAEEMARRSGSDPLRDVYPRVLASAGMTALVLAASLWYRQEGRRPFIDVVHEVLDQLAAGMSHPVAGRPGPS